MCSQFMKRMENYQGDLADVVRATASGVDGGSTAAEVAAAAVVPDWQFPSNTINYSSDPAEDFGDPFSYMRDPFMQNIDNPASGFFYNSNIVMNNGGGVEENGGISLAHKVLDDEIKRPSNIFSRMLQISPNAELPVSPCDSQAAAAAVAAAAPPPTRRLKGPPILVPNNRTLISPGSSNLQISSPRNTGIKRRKSQARKVVCIPAPAPANSRATGEVVPSDLWAWRKYGQKPIKGSPYPRGYYRCSSSKGCSARKQVERSRTDPNMLVITYTSEHNHPWPTQRNALAGSTRSQLSKNNSAAKNSSPNSQTQKPTNPKQEQKEISTENKVISSTVDENSAAVKEETDQDFDNRLEMEEAEFDEGFPQAYKPTLSDPNHSEDSFFADLGEIETDPLSLLFTQGFSRDDLGREKDDLDPFSFYDWSTNNSNAPARTAATTTTTTTTVSSTTSYGESNRDS